MTPILKTMAALAAAGMLAACTPRPPGAVPALVQADDAVADTVATDTGRVRGARTAQGRAFLGIPFAAPPVGALRLRPPAPAAAWSGVRDATRAGPACLPRHHLGGAEVSEDCLTLNVYAPSAAAAHPRAVMVWLYGGALELGSNVDYDLSALARRQDVIVVAPNYRLGALGFLAHPALRGPGEGAYALLDQQAALRWVQRNIGAFGGDPRNVTLFGESAGAWSTCYQLNAPGAAGLFRRAILQSGSCLTADSAVDRETAERGGRRMARELGCKDGRDVAACLRALPARTLVAAESRRRGLTGEDAWAPMHGGDVLPLAPAASVAAGRSLAVPVMLGNNRDEGRLFAGLLGYGLRLQTRGDYEKRVGRMYPQAAPVLAEYAPLAAQSRWQAYAELVTDGSFACPIRRLGQALAARAPVYAYEFDDPQAPFGLPRWPFATPLRSFHAAELVYVFQRPWVLSGDRPLAPRQQALSRAMQDYWGAFARHGDPNGPGRPAWPRFDGRTPLALSVDGIAPTHDFARVHRCDFWDAQAR